MIFTAISGSTYSQVSDPIVTIMTAEEKQIIIARFMEKVYGRKPDTSSSNPNHEGKEGHWLETQMDVGHNASNAPDLFGFEMKNNTQSKTSFGDWNASYYIFRDEKFFPNLIGAAGRTRLKLFRENKAQFLRIFGRENEGMFSWSGTPCPKRVTDGFNDFGQEMTVDSDNSIVIKYSFSHDKRPDKSEIIPKMFQTDNLKIVVWNSETIKQKVEQKFNRKGWFKCLQNKDGIYASIVFGGPFSIEKFLKVVKDGHVIFDSGMKDVRSDGTDRYRSMWRASNSFWDSWVEERYP